MTKAKRGQALRGRFKALGGIPYVGNRTRVLEPVPEAKKRQIYPFNAIEPQINLRRCPLFYREFVVMAPTVRPRRNVGESPLTRMSRKLCLKLPKVRT